MVSARPQIAEPRAQADSQPEIAVSVISVAASPGSAADQVSGAGAGALR
jgi:hypothetical protein